MVTETQHFDLAAELGAEPGFSVQKFTIYLPDRDKENKPVPDIEEYVEAAMELLLDINTGVTRLPPSEGMFLNREKGIKTQEKTHLVYSFLFDPDAFQNRIGDIASFLRDFGRNTGQDSVMVELAGEEPIGGALGPYVCRAYMIKNY
jgi:hypothetical protein